MTIGISRINLLFAVIFINFLLDYIFYIDSLSDASQGIRVLINVVFLIGGVFICKETYSLKWVPYFICIVYWMVLLPRSSELGRSIPEYIKVVIGVSFILAGYISCRGEQGLLRLLHRLLVIIPAYLAMVILSNLLGWGDTSYVGEESSAFRTALGDAKLYAPAFMVGLSPFIISKMESRSKRYFWSLASLICLVVMILTLRRTALLIIVALSAVYMILSMDIKNIIKIIAFSSLVVTVASVKFYSVFQERLESRSYLTSGDYSLADEGRFLEFFSVIDAFDAYGNDFVYLYGMEPFNTIGNYGFYKDRPIHVDYTYIFFSSGFLGIVFYIFFFASVFYSGLRLYLKKRSGDTYRMFSSIFLVVIIVGFSGNVWAVTYKVFSFALLGAFWGALRNDDA